MSGLKLLVFLSSVREPRNADRVLKLVTRLATEKGFLVTIMDPLKENLPMLKTPLHYYPNQREAPQQLQALNQQIVDSDAYLMITAEYNCGVPPALLNMIDHFPPPSFAFKPAAIVSYSMGQGGVSSCSHLENTLIYLGCMVQPFTVNIQFVENAISSNGEALESSLIGHFKILLDQLEFTGMALKHEKELGNLKLPKLNEFF